MVAGLPFMPKIVIPSAFTVTIDRCGHLFPGNESQAAELLDAYLESVLRE
jgi:hypothetical protein